MPWLRDNGTVIVNLVQIKPRITSNLNSSVPRTAVAGQTILTMAATTPYTPNNIIYSIAVNGYDANNQSAFVMNGTTGVLSLATPLPVFDYNNVSYYTLQLAA